MMNDEKSLLQDILDALTARAEEEFLKTEEGELLRERRARMDRECAARFSPEDWAFIQDTYCDLLDFEFYKRKYACQQAVRDCVKLLKQLEVLA